METTKTEGRIREAVGGVQETIGNLASDAGMQVSGKAHELRGKAQQLCADATAVARESIIEKPLATLAVTAAAAFALGMLWSWNRADEADGRVPRRR
jgi:uncharacterized protein YjbJ (UPF0337 family)